MQRVDAKTRFLVMERDGYSCRCCGNIPPEVILEVDKIDEGTALSSYLTLCRPCFEGKKAAEGEEVEIKKFVGDREMNAALRSQLTERIEWFKMTSGLTEYVIDKAFYYADNLSSLKLTNTHRSYLRHELKSYPLFEVLTGLDIAFRQYESTTEEELEELFKKLSGILYNRRRAGVDKRAYYFFMIRKESEKKYGVCKEDVLKELVWKYMSPIDERVFNNIMKTLRTERTWDSFVEKVWLMLGKSNPKEEKASAPLKNGLGTLKDKKGKAYSVYQDATGKGIIAVSEEDGAMRVFTDKKEIKKMFDFGDL